MPEQETKPGEQKQAVSPTPQKSSNTKLIIIIVVVAAVLVILGGGAYYANQYFAEKSAEELVEKATGGKVDVEEDGDKVTLETDEGKVTVGQNDVPDSFPSDITIYSGSEVTLTSATEGKVMVVLETTDSVSKVFEFYQSDLSKNDWKQISATAYQGASIVNAEKGNSTLLITVALDDQNDKTTITILVNKT